MKNEPKYTLVMFAYTAKIEDPKVFDRLDARTVIDKYVDCPEDPDTIMFMRDFDSQDAIMDAFEQYRHFVSMKWQRNLDESITCFVSTLIAVDNDYGGMKIQYNLAQCYPGTSVRIKPGTNN